MYRRGCRVKGVTLQVSRFDPIIYMPRQASKACGAECVCLEAPRDAQRPLTVSDSPHIFYLITTLSSLICPVLVNLIHDLPFYSK